MSDNFRFNNEEIDLQKVKKIAEVWGYGNVIRFLSEEWKKEDPIGALSIGPCYGVLVNIEEE